jgi:hypothetical protein
MVYPLVKGGRRDAVARGDFYTAALELRPSLSGAYLDWVPVPPLQRKHHGQDSQQSPVKAGPFACLVKIPPLVRCAHESAPFDKGVNLIGAGKRQSVFDNENCHASR